MSTPYHATRRVGGVVAAGLLDALVGGGDLATSGDDGDQGDADGQHHEPEDPAPREGGREPRRDRWAEQRRQHPRGGDDAEDLGPQGFRVGAADDDVGRDDDQAGAEAGHAAPEQEQPEAGRRAAQTAADAEEELSGVQARQRSGAVAPDAGEDDAEQLGGEHDGEGQAVGPHRVELAGDVGHGGGDGHALERDDGDECHERQGTSSR